MTTTKKDPCQVDMAHSGDNKARRPLPPLPYHYVRTGRELSLTLSAGKGDHEDPDIHMYHYVDKDEINKRRHTDEQEKQHRQTAVVGTGVLTVPVCQKVPDALVQEDGEGISRATITKEKDQKANDGDNKARRPLPPLPSQDINTGGEIKVEIASTDSNEVPNTSNANVYNYLDSDDINNLRQQPADTETDDSVPKTTDSNIPGLLDDGTYVPGAFRQGCNVSDLLYNEMYVPGAFRQGKER
ncbi:uncharacterized protein LOC118405436 [Branchiostoma floridae]|uniref:Uncharacterized protein LOC118405436 n=1 Tax=Branchiostoma floridae TaxID=7739 RepID=A0A9J7HJW7_BRAFL|nr:uncharacterized protein LOC118405436 [Branchiostoma floridae]